MPSRLASSATEPMRPLTRASKQRRARLTSLRSTGSGLVALGSGASMANLLSTPRRLDPQRKLSGEDATSQSVRGRCGRRERDERHGSSADHWTELDPVDYRLDQISSSGIGHQAL